VAIGFFAYALVDAWRSTDGTLPAVWRMLLAGGIWWIGELGAAFAWMVLLNDRRVEIGAGLLAAQLAKYIPGAVWQPASQVGLARSTGVSVRRAVVAFTANAVVIVATGCVCLILLAAVWTEISDGFRVLLALGGIASVLLFDRRWMVFVLGRIPRTRDESQALVPRQPAIVLSAVGILVALLSAASSYLVLLGSFGTIDDPLLVVAAFITAFTVGFVVIPLPSGFGVRELVLTAILAGMFPGSVIVAASVYQRLVSITAEGIMAGGATLVLRRRRLPATEPDMPAATEPTAT
jgi:uncharacterized membrane protein YbhN (UPF0104 family)